MKEFLNMVKVGGDDSNYCVVVSDMMGVKPLLMQTLKSIGIAEVDILEYNGRDLGVEQVREVVKEVEYSPRGVSNRIHVVVENLHKLPMRSVAPFLSMMENRERVRFICLLSRMNERIRPIVSRMMVVHIPFLEKRVVVGNLQRKGYSEEDVGVAYDGTLSGTQEMIGGKGIEFDVKKKLREGGYGLYALLESGQINSSIFTRMVKACGDKDVARYMLGKGSSGLKKKLGTYMMSREKMVDDDRM